MLKAVALRPRAEEDLVHAARRAAEGGTALGEAVFDAALAALRPMQSMPAMGSPRLGQVCGIAGLRSCRVAGFPLAWLYFESAEHLGVVRLLGVQEIGAMLSEDD